MSYDARVVPRRYGVGSALLFILVCAANAFGAAPATSAPGSRSWIEQVQAREYQLIRERPWDFLYDLPATQSEIRLPLDRPEGEKRWVQLVDAIGQAGESRNADEPVDAEAERRRAVGIKNANAVLTMVLKYCNEQVRREADAKKRADFPPLFRTVSALETFGTDAEPSLPALAETAELLPATDWYFGSSSRIAKAVGQRWTNAATDRISRSQQRRTTQAALARLQKGMEDAAGGDAALLSGDALMDVRWAVSQVGRSVSLFELIRAYPLRSLAVAVALLIVLSNAILYSLRPRTIVTLDRLLEKWHIPLKIFHLESWADARYVLLVGFLRPCDRVLDDWVSFHAEKAREQFKGKPNVEGDDVRIAVPIELTIDGKETELPDLSDDVLKNWLSHPECLLIHGEPRSGKTALACGIALKALGPPPANSSKRNKTKSPLSHRMLPILIDRPAATKDGGEASPYRALMAAVRGELQYLIGGGSDVTEELLQDLLRKRRLLVIIDGLSELGHETRGLVAPNLENFPLVALIVTSRQREKLGNARRTEIRTQPVKSDVPAETLEKFATPELLKSPGYQNASEKFSLFVKGRALPVELIKLIAEDAIVRAKQPQDAAAGRPVAAIVIEYLEHINDAVPRPANDPASGAPPASEWQPTDEVRQLAKVVAWACVKGEDAAQPATRARLLSVCGPKSDPALDYLEEKLRLLVRANGADGVLRFANDLVAEALAAARAAEEFGDDPQQWKDAINWDSYEVATADGPPRSVFPAALLQCAGGNYVHLIARVLDRLPNPVKPIFDPPPNPAKPIIEVTVLAGLRKIKRAQPPDPAPH
jgi:hypothetical protein